MFVQNNFESWPNQPVTSTHEDVLFSTHTFHNNISNNFTCNNLNNNNDNIYDSNSIDENSQALLEFDFCLDNEILAFQLEEQEGCFNVSPEDSLKAISTGDLFDYLSQCSPSDNSLLDQDIVSPVSNNVVPESSESSGEDTGDSLLKKVDKSGRVTKRESNKIAAGRYRAKKLKERDGLFKECDQYEVKNGRLKEKISDIELEIKCIKNLLVQALNSKKF